MGKIYKYIRVSTAKQDFLQQDNTIRGWLAGRGLNADETIADHGIPGTTEYNKRHLGDLCRKLEPGDTLVVSEFSRLTRGGVGALYKIVEDFFKPKSINLVLCANGVSVNCANMTAQDEIYLSMLAGFARMERDYISQRQKSSFAARRRLLQEQGGYFTKDNRWKTSLGGRPGIFHPHGGNALSQARRIAILGQREELYRYAKELHAEGLKYGEIAQKVNEMGFCAPNGGLVSIPLVCKVLNDWGKYFELGANDLTEDLTKK